MQSSPQQETIILQGFHSSHDPYCRDPDCWCHSSDQWHSQVVAMPHHTDEEICKAFSAFGLIRQ